MARWLVAAATTMAVVFLSGGVGIASHGDSTVRRRVGPGSIAAGKGHTVMALPDGRVMAWGAGERGQIGDGALVDRWSPTVVAGVSDIIAVAAGAAHTVAVTANGGVFAWGANTFGRLGDGTQKRRASPIRVKGLTDVRAVAAGRAHTLALTADGTVYAWGRNLEGQLGLGHRSAAHEPVKIGGLSRVIGIAAGDTHSLAVTADGRVFAWGNNQASRLGDGTTKDRTRPVPVPIVDVVAVAAGGAHSLALTRSGIVYSWGRGAQGQLGTGVTRVSSTPKEIAGLRASAIAAGENFSAAIQYDGRVVTWGANGSGQLGDGTIVRRLRPVITNVDQAVNLALGSAHAVAVTPGGDVRTWGEGQSGQLGNGSNIDASAAVEIISDIAGWGPDGDQPPEPPHSPDMTPPGGIYAEAQLVTLIPAAAGDTIRFTVDGSDPNDASPVFSAPFTVDSSSTVKARSYSNGLASDVRTEDYVIDTVAPVIMATTAPPVSEGWMTSPVTVSFECSDNIAIASCSAPVTVAAEGHQEVVGIAVDRAGRRSTTTVAVNLDLSAPAITIAQPQDGSTTDRPSIHLSAAVIDVSGAAEARCNGEPAVITPGQLDCDVVVYPGRNDVAVSVTDAVGHVARVAVTVNRQGTPTRISLSPVARTLEVNEVGHLSLLDDFGAHVDGATWSSSDAAIVTLSDDNPPLLTALTAGEVTIGAEKDGMRAEATVRVVPALAAGDMRWIVPATPDYSTEAPLFTHRVDATVPHMFTVETQDWGQALLRAVTDEGEVLWQQQSPGVPFMGDSFGGVVAGVLDASGSSFGSYSRIGGGTAPPWRFLSSGTLEQPAQASDGTLYGLEFLPGTVTPDGQQSWDKFVLVIDGESGSLISRTMLPREIDNFVSAQDGVVLPTTPPTVCRSARYETAPETVGPIVGVDGRGYFVVRRYHIESWASCNPPFRRRPDRAIAMGLDLYSFGRDGEPRVVDLFSTSCTGELGTTLPCDLKVRPLQLLPDAIGGTLVTWERGTSMVGSSVFVQRSMSRVDAEAAVSERLVSPRFEVEMMGQAGFALAYGDGGYEVTDVVGGETQWTNPLTNLTPLASRPDGGLASLDAGTGELVITNASAEIESRQPFGLDWRAVRAFGNWIGRVGSKVAAVVGDFLDATRFGVYSGGNVQGQLTVRRPGMGIFAKTHLALETPGDLARYRHVSIRVVPRDWQYWLEQGIELRGTDAFGNGFFTLGAGLNDDDTSLFCEGTLISKLNRPADYLTPPKDALEDLPYPTAVETQIIQALLDRDAAYKDDLPYACFPERFYNAGFYNSNSYAHGLLNAVGLPLPRLPERLPGLMPGWLTPVPVSKFQ